MGIDYNIADSDDKKVIIGQTITGTIALSMVADYALTKTLIKAVEIGTEKAVVFAIPSIGKSTIVSVDMCRRLKIYRLLKIQKIGVETLQKLTPKDLKYVLEAGKAARAAIKAGSTAENRTLKAAEALVKQAVDEAGEELSEKTISKIAKELAENGTEKLTETITKEVTEELVEKAAKKAGEELAEKAATKIAKEAGEELAEKAAIKIAKELAEKAATKIAVKVSVNLGKAILKDITFFGTLCGTVGVATGGIGCVIALALTVMLIVFDVVNLIMDLIDPTGIGVLIKRADIDAVAEATMQALNTDNPQIPNFLDSEVFFSPISFIFGPPDNESNPTMDPVWGPKYNNYMDEYMTSIGIIGDWRSRIPVVEFFSGPGILTADIALYNKLLSDAIKREAETPIPKTTPIPKKSNTTLIIFLIVGVCLIIFLFVILKKRNE